MIGGLMFAGAMVGGLGAVIYAMPDGRATNRDAGCFVAVFLSLVTAFLAGWLI